jgi:hypothetical protein
MGCCKSREKPVIQIPPRTGSTVDVFQSIDTKPIGKRSSAPVKKTEGWFFA